MRQRQIDQQFIEAVKKSNIPEIEALLENGANVHAKSSTGWTALHFAASANKPVVIDYLIVTHKADCDVRDPDGSTPMHLATLNGNILAIACLLKHKAKVNAKDKEGNTPMHIAALYNMHEIIQFLVIKGANAHAKNCNKVTPMDIAKEQQHEDLYKVLEDAMALPVTTTQTSSHNASNAVLKSTRSSASGFAGKIARRGDPPPLATVR